MSKSAVATPLNYSVDMVCFMILCTFVCTLKYPYALLTLVMDITDANISNCFREFVQNHTKYICGIHIIFHVKKYTQGKIAKL